jgi:Zn-dependent peptidase ImmA (M78 family)
MSAGGMRAQSGRHLVTFQPTRRIHDRHQEWLTSGTMIRRLRRLMPDRLLGVGEAFEIAERQAMLLLAVAGIDHAPVPVEVIGELSSVTVRRLNDTPVAGASFWSGSTWVIVVDDDLCAGHQHMTLAHEFKHIVDHRDRGRYVDDDLVEPIAEYFARCVVLPRPWVKAAIAGGVRAEVELAELFGVALSTLRVRLKELGLADSVVVVRRRWFSWTERSRHLHRVCQRRQCRHQAADHG